MNRGEATRKTRSDKKREVKALLPVELKDFIYRISYVTHTPVKDVGERLCNLAIHEAGIIADLSKHFRRGIHLDNVFYSGSTDTPGIQKRTPGEKDRISMRLNQRLFELVAVISYALDCQPSRTVAVLLQMIVKDYAIMGKYINDALPSHLTNHQKRELGNILSYIKNGGIP